MCGSPTLSCRIGADLEPAFWLLGMDAAGWVPVSELLDSLMGMATEAAVYEVIRDCPKVPHHPPWLLLPASRDFTAVWRIAQLEAMINIQTVHVEQFVNCFTVQTSSELQQQYV